MGITIVKHNQGMQFTAENRGHKTLFDLPKEQGGANTAPTPPEVFISSLGACIGVYVVGYCERHNIPHEGLDIKLLWEKADNPARIDKIEVQINFPQSIPADKKPVILKVANSCLVHNTLMNHPEITVIITD
jgi:putative redox protein